MTQTEVASVPTDPETDRHYQAADELDQEHPDWLVTWGYYTREYIAFPLFHTGRRTILHAADPKELVERIQQVEERVAQGQRTRRAREYPDM